MTVVLALIGILSAVGGPASDPHPRWNSAGGLQLRHGSAPGAAGVGSSRNLLRLQWEAGVHSWRGGSGGLLRLRGGVSKYYNQTALSQRGGIFEDVRGGVECDEGQSEWNKGGLALCRPRVR